MKTRGATKKKAATTEPTNVEAPNPKKTRQAASKKTAPSKKSVPPLNKPIPKKVTTKNVQQNKPSKKVPAKPPATIAKKLFPSTSEDESSVTSQNSTTNHDSIISSESSDPDDPNTMSLVKDSQRRRILTDKQFEIFADAVCYRKSIGDIITLKDGTPKLIPIKSTKKLAAGGLNCADAWGEFADDDKTLFQDNNGENLPNSKYSLCVFFM
jgi:hypothetical protein